MQLLRTIYYKSVYVWTLLCACECIHVRYSVHLVQWALCGSVHSG